MCLQEIAPALAGELRTLIRVNHDRIGRLLIFENYGSRKSKLLVTIHPTKVAIESYNPSISLTTPKALGAIWE